jgi:predicted small lipoprotein YifL
MQRCAGFIAALVGLGTLVGCGVKGPPLPPVIRVADPTRDLTVYQDDRHAVLSWSYPSSTTSGESLYDLESVEIWRTTLLEADAPPQGEDARERNLNRQFLIGNGELVAELDDAGLDAATRGSMLEWYDNLDRWRRDHPADERQIIWYAVRTVCCRGRESGLSNIARLVPEDSPPPPTGLTAAAEIDGIRLTWVPHEETPAIVERSSGGALWEQITTKPLATGEWLDRGAAQGGSWNYRLRSVVKPEGRPRIIGEAGSVTGVFYPDIYPPQAPVDLVCLPEGTQVRLRWRSTDRNVSYRVYRGDQGKTPEVLAEDLGSAQFEDLAPPPGTSVYEVTAVDAAGNESPAATCIAARGSSR